MNDYNRFPDNSASSEPVSSQPNARARVTAVIIESFKLSRGDPMLHNLLLQQVAPVLADEHMLPVL